jgi:cyclopropane fatty-acyl-phospholipid synthase-like methyltransferase
MSSAITIVSDRASEPDKPYSAACERNRHPILEVLRVHLAQRSRVLEIGSGTGQHAVFFATNLPHLCWQCSDRAEYLDGICQWLDEAALPNTPKPWTLDVNDTQWPIGAQGFDALYSANTLHIMAWSEVQTLFRRLPEVLLPQASVVIYGPFRRGGRHTSESNAEFDAELRERAAHMGIRDLEAVDVLARGAGLKLIADLALPANNAAVVWQRG